MVSEDRSTTLVAHIHKSTGQQKEGDVKNLSSEDEY